MEVEKTVGNKVEYLDGFKNPHSTDIILSSLNVIDRTQKRVCELTLVGPSGTQFPIEVIIPADSIPKPPVQSMDCFKKCMGPKGKSRLIEKITEEDINSLPLILLGLNYQKYFPCEISKEVFSKSFQNTNPGMAFFTSQFSNKALASGIKEVDSQLSLVNMVSYKLIEYNEIKEEPKDFCQPPIKVEILPSHDSDSTEKTIFHEITSTNLDEKEKIIRQDMSSDIIMITDEEDPQILNYDNEAVFPQILL